MSDAEREHLLANRPYTSLEDLRRRGGLSHPTAENLCRAGALDTLAGLDGATERRALLLEVEERWGGRTRARGAGRGAQPEQERLDLYADHKPRLPPASLADAVRDEIAVLGLDVTRHVVSFYEPLFDVLDVTRAVDLVDRTDGERVRVAGVRVALQSPPVRSGQQVLFLSLDDRTGQTQTNFFESVLRGDRDGSAGGVAWTVLHAWLVVVEGRVRRNGPRGVTVIGERAWDLTRLWRAWREDRLDGALATVGPPPRGERQTERPTGLSAAMFASGSR